MSACRPSYYRTLVTLWRISARAEFRQKYWKALKELKENIKLEDYLFTVEEVDNAISELKRGKAAGIDGLTAEHLQACHPILVSLLVKLFNTMLIAEYVPDAFGVGLSIPLPKSLSENLHSSEAYRCITVSPVISKVFEKCVLEKVQALLITSHLQFGFKKKLSCSHAIYSLNTTVDHFVNNQSTVNICSIDLSKAFDRVNNYCLFVKLLERKVPRKFVLLLACWYTKVYIVVKWVDALSHMVKLLAGVRQGGILSPILFLVFVDDILHALQSSRLGCIIKGFYIGAMMYADDIILLSSSVSMLQSMIDLCFNELAKVDILINDKKTMCLRIGRRFKDPCCELFVNGVAIKWVEQLRYLGILVNSGRTFKIDLTRAKRKFFISCNSIFSKIEHSRADIILPLISPYCTPVLLYGLDALKLNKTELNRLDHPYIMVFHKIFGTYSKSIISQCQYYTGCLPMQYLVKLRKLCFLNNMKLYADDNIMCKYLYQNFGYFQFISIANEFGIVEKDCKFWMKRKMWSSFKDSLRLLVAFHFFFSVCSLCCVLLYLHYYFFLSLDELKLISINTDTGSGGLAYLSPGYL